MRVVRMRKFFDPFRHFAAHVSRSLCRRAQAGKELPHPLEAAASSRRLSLRVFVREVRCDAEERLAMHRFCAQLYLKSAAIAGVDGRVDALIAVGFWECDVIFDFSRHRPPMRVNDAERRVTISDGRKYDAQRTDVI